MISLALWPLFSKWISPYTVRDGVGLSIAQTNNRLSDVAYFITDTAENIKEKSFSNKITMPQTIDELMKWFFKYNPELLELFKERRWIEPDNDTFIDAWGKPVKLEVKSEKEYIFISSGPNKKFENGKGDDITYSFNPYEFKEEDR